MAKEKDFESQDYILEKVLSDLIRHAVRAETQEIIAKFTDADGDRLLSVEEVAKILSVSTDWVYRHTEDLPFVRKLGPKMLRFSYNGLHKWLITRAATRQ